MKKLTLLPTNYRGKAYERIGLKIRDFAGIAIEEPLDPFALAEFVKIAVIRPGELIDLPPEILLELTGRSRSSWSAVTFRLPNGNQLCIINPTHTVERTRATLMEEIAHVVLGHEPTCIHIGAGGLPYREYNTSNEQAAYGVGAAALVPYAALFAGLMDGATAESIAQRYGVSSQLVSYRIKITMLWPVYKAKSAVATG